MTLPLVEATPEVIGGWIVNAGTQISYSGRAGALTAAYENMGPKGVALMLQKMKLDTVIDVIEWLASGKK